MSATSASVLYVDNRDLFHHTFTVDVLGIDVDLPAATARTVVLDGAAPGVYDIVCDVPGHEDMVGTLEITGSGPRPWGSPTARFDRVALALVGAVVLASATWSAFLIDSVLIWLPVVPHTLIWMIGTFLVLRTEHRVIGWLLAGSGLFVTSFVLGPLYADTGGTLARVGVASGHWLAINMGWFSSPADPPDLAIALPSIPLFLSFPEQLRIYRRRPLPAVRGRPDRVPDGGVRAGAGRARRGVRGGRDRADLTEVRLRLHDVLGRTVTPATVAVWEPAGGNRPTAVR